MSLDVTTTKIKNTHSRRNSNASHHLLPLLPPNKRPQTILLILVAATFLTIVCYTTIVIRNINRQPPHLLDAVSHHSHDDDDNDEDDKIEGSNQIIEVVRKKNGRQLWGTPCHLPKLNPFDKSIVGFFMEKIPRIDCTKGNSTIGPKPNIQWPLLFTSEVEDVTGRSILVHVASPKKFGYRDFCCYRIFLHKNGTQSKSIFSKTCTEISLKSPRTVIPDWAQFVSIQCRNSTGSMVFVDFFEFFPHISTTSKVPKHQSTKNSEKVSLVVLGLDAMSHMNFIRTMPRSDKFLTENLGAFKMSGYNKVGDNTFPNLVPALSGLTTEELKDSCWTSDSASFDNCSFIWNEFEEAGYLTAYSEDASWMSTFDYLKEGFYYSPTHYYSKPMLDLLDEEVGHEETSNSKLCYGPRLGLQVILDGMTKLAKSVNLKYDVQKSQKYFQFLWQNSLTHDELNFGKLGDSFVLKALQNFETSGYLKKDTILVLMSDHGIRWGDIMDTLQGKLEGMMPFLYFVFPEWFKKRYSAAVKNFKKNENRLTTPFDLHATFQDLVDLTKIENHRIITRQLELATILKATTTMMNASTMTPPVGASESVVSTPKNDSIESESDADDDEYYGAEENSKMPRGISLFLPIPLGRTCEDAGIDENWCLCQKRVAVEDPNNFLVIEATHSVIRVINKRLKNYPQCSNLTLDRVLAAQIIQELNDGGDGDWSTKPLTQRNDPRLKKLSITLYITLAVQPSQAHFETSVTRDVSGEWRVGGEIGRSNLYGEQSRCVKALHLKKFCFCTN